jgi:hypothetical protein
MHCLTDESGIEKSCDPSGVGGYNFMDCWVWQGYDRWWRVGLLPCWYNRSLSIILRLREDNAPSSPPNTFCSGPLSQQKNYAIKNLIATLEPTTALMPGYINQPNHPILRPNASSSACEPFLMVDQLTPPLEPLPRRPLLKNAITRVLIYPPSSPTIII